LKRLYPLSKWINVLHPATRAGSLSLTHDHHTQEKRNVFVRPCWRPASPQDALDIIEQHPWALLVSNGEDVPLATNLPLMIDRTVAASDHAALVLNGHIARGNDHLRALSIHDSPVLAIFQGPWSYVTASWYPNRDMPSTYYYTAVHCSGSIELLDEQALDNSLEDLTQRMESHYQAGWSTREIPRSEITRRFAAIQGFRIHVSKIEAKFKLGQDEPVRDARAVAEVLARRQSPQDRALAELIFKHNETRGV
jgi:transcriptional regulator